MDVKVCDVCKKVLDKNNTYVSGFILYRYDLCKDCYKKFNEIIDEYEIKSEALLKEQEELTKYTKNKIKELGLEV